MASVPPSPGPRRAIAWPSTSVIRWMRDRVVAAGGDPTDIPDEPVAMWRLPEVERRTGYTRATLYRLSAAGKFPRPVALTPEAA